MTEHNFGTKGDVGSRPKRQTTLLGTRKEGGIRLLSVNPRGEARPRGRGAPQRKAELEKREGNKYGREEPQLVGLRPKATLTPKAMLKGPPHLGSCPPSPRTGCRYEEGTGGN